MKAREMKEVKFYRCNACGNLMVKLVDGGVTPICCGKPMEQLKPQVEESGAGEKHVPVVLVNGERVTVSVGEVAHPMEEDHFIGFGVLDTGRGFDVKELKTNDHPVAQFLINEDEEVKAVYAWCNKHGLWKAEKIKHV